MTINHEGTWQDKDSFEAYKRGESVSFDRAYVDGGFRIAIDGWIEPVICGHYYNGVYMHWDVNGRALCAGDPDIVEIVE